MDGDAPHDTTDRTDGPAPARAAVRAARALRPWLPPLLLAAAVVAGTAGIVYWLAERPRPAPVEITLATPTPPAPPVVHVVGAVVGPGVYTLPRGARVSHAIEAAGGPLPTADMNALNLAAVAVDGSRLAVPTRVPGPAASTAGASGAAGHAAAGTPAAGAPAGPLDLNTATEAQLDGLPGIGPVLARRIIEWREANGGFVSLDDLLGVAGIGPATVEELRGLVVQE